MAHFRPDGMSLKKQDKKYQATLDRLNFKISRYDVAIKTGVLSWDDCKEE